MLKSSIVAILITITGVMGAHAADLVLGIGVTDFSADEAEDSLKLSAGLQGAPFGRLGPFEFRPTVGGAADFNGDFWVGVGIAALSRFGQNGWFVEASVMPGAFLDGEDDNDLGSTFEIRSLIGLGKYIGPTTALSAAFEHTSNAGAGSHNPGENAWMLRLRRSF